MFCKKCGRQIDDGSVFCKLCGASQTDAAAPTAPTAPAAKKKSKSKKVWGIVLLAFGACALLGGLENGSLVETFSAGAGLEDFTLLFFEIALIVGGGYLLYSHSLDK